MSDTLAATPTAVPAAPAAPAGHRDVLTVMSGLLLAVFGATLSSTIVTNALPRIIADLDGSQRQYTWVVTAMLLTVTATGPVWGSMADRAGRRGLTQLSIAVFAVASVLAGFAPTAEALIGCRVLQGIGMGGLLTLVQVVMASIVAPRDRGRYMGYFSVVATVATVGGPLLGGLIVDAPGLGWRWCFWVSVPVAVAALVLLHATLRVPAATAAAPIDWAGILLLPTGVAALLVWVTLAGSGFGWVSWTSLGLSGGAVAVLGLAVAAQRRATAPVLPGRLLRQPTVALAVVASAVVGMALTGASVFLPQYFQLARDFSPTASGLLTLPLAAGVAIAAVTSGRLVARTGRWKRYVVGGAALVSAGLAVLASAGVPAPVPLIVAGSVLLAAGIGAARGTLMLAAQNSLPYRDLGAGTSAVSFFHLLGGAVGVSALGALLAARVGDHAGGSGYGTGIALVFLVMAGVSVVALVAGALLREAPLRTTVGEPAGDPVSSPAAGTSPESGRCSGGTPRTSGSPS